MKKQTVSLCILTLNNEHSIGMAIKSALVLVDEVIVVDLGSSDNTVYIAEGYGARFISYDFEDDYAKARNVALDAVASDWVLWLNPNEYVMPIRPREFLNILATKSVGFRVTINSEDNDTPKEELRLYRFHPRVSYRYPVHERIEESLRQFQYYGDFGEVASNDVLKIFCDTSEKGISPNSNQTIKILKNAIIKDPHDPYLEYTLGCEFFHEIEGELIPGGQVPDCFHALQKAWDKSLGLTTSERRHANYLSDLMYKLAACHRASGRLSLAWQVISAAKEIYPQDYSIAMQYLATGISYLSNIVRDNKSPEAKDLILKLLASIRMLGELEINDAYIAKHLGDLSLFMGELSKAKSCFMRSLKLNDKYSYACLGLAQCHLYQGEKKQAIKYYMEAVRLNEHNCTAWLQGSRLLEEIGFKDNAAIWQNTITDRFPYFLESQANS